MSVHRLTSKIQISTGKCGAFSEYRRMLRLFFTFVMTKTLWYIFNDGKLLLRKTGNDSYEIPAGELSPVDIADAEHVHSFVMPDGAEAKSFVSGDAGTPADMEYVPLRRGFFLLPSDVYRMAGKMEELIYWDKETRFCGRCGGKMEFSSDISKKCTDCGHTIWPGLQIAIIVLVKRGDEILLVQSRSFKSDYMGLIAGFVETGETLEQAVSREVMEETQVRIKNLRYIRSQVWPFPCNLMAGFVADYDGGEIKIQESELRKGGWFTRDHMPAVPDEASIARQLINAWLNGDI